MRFAKLIGAVCICLVTSLSGYAAVPQVINYQGFLTGTGGAALDTTANVTFRIFDVASGGSPIWTETQSVTSIDGLFTVLLGINTSIDETIIDGADRFLEVQLNTSPFSPRTQLAASPYAIRIATVDGASGGTISSDLNITGNVGIGTASPQAPLEVYYDNLNPLAPAIAINNPNLGGQNVIDFRFSGTSHANIRKAFGGGMFMGTTAGEAVNLFTSSTNRLTVAGGGNVGIGTTTPASRLDVAGGNFNLENSTASAGNIMKGGARFIHNFGTNNTFVGANAGNLTMTGNSNTAGGYQALASNTTGNFNTADGVQALLANTTGERNSAIGAAALLANSTGSENTANGAYSLYSNTAGNGNTACGVGALFSCTTGVNNTADGVSALTNNTTGGNNTASGYNALLSNTTGSSNTASGRNALASNTTGLSNTASGRGALSVNTTGSNNTAIGFGADVSAGDLTNATAIGNGAVVNASNKIRLGNSAVTVIEGQVAYTFTSDKNQKENFQPVDGNEVLKKLRGLELSSWNYKGHDPKQFRHYGPMAQEFFAAFGDDGVGKVGTETTLNTGDVAGILMIVVQALSEQNELVKSENQDLRNEMKELREMLQKLLAQEGTPVQTYTVSQQ